MALTDKRTYETMGPTVRVAGVFKASDTYYKGAILCNDVNGLLAVGAGAATDIPAGIFTGYGVDSGDAGVVAGAGTALVGEVEKGKTWIPFTGAVQSDVGELFYVAGDDTVTQTAGTNAYGMMCEAFKTGYVLLDFNALIKV